MHVRIIQPFNMHTCIYYIAIAIYVPACMQPLYSYTATIHSSYLHACMHRIRLNLLYSYIVNYNYIYLSYDDPFVVGYSYTTMYAWNCMYRYTYLSLPALSSLYIAIYIMVQLQLYSAISILNGFQTLAAVALI